MARLRQTLLLWHCKVAHRIETLRYRDRADIQALMNLQYADPVRHAVKSLLFFACQCGFRQWSLTARGPSWDPLAILEYETRQLGELIKIGRGDAPLSTDADQPPELSHDAVANWLASTANRPSGQWTDAFRFIRGACQNYVAAKELKLIAEAFPRDWPRVRVQLWEMCVPDRGSLPWLLFSNVGRSRGAIELVIDGKPVKINLRFMQEKIDIHMEDGAIPDGGGGARSQDENKEV